MSARGHDVLNTKSNYLFGTTFELWVSISRNRKRLNDISTSDPNSERYFDRKIWPDFRFYIFEFSYFPSFLLPHIHANRKIFPEIDSRSKQKQEQKWNKNRNHCF